MRLWEYPCWPVEDTALPFQYPHTIQAFQRRHPTDIEGSHLDSGFQPPELGPEGITVNAVAPGFIKTAKTDAIPERDRNAMISMIPSQKLGTPEDVAALVCFLASDLAGYITGQVIHINGGLYM